MKIAKNFMAGFYVSSWLPIKFSSTETLTISYFEYSMLALENNLSKITKPSLT